MSDFDLVISGKVVLPTHMVENGWIGVRAGKIAALGEGPRPGAREKYDAGEALVLPGAIDSHVHSRSQRDQEGFGLSTIAAASGGVTTICDMPYDDGILISDVQTFEDKKAEAEAKSVVDFGLYATINPADGIRNMQALANAGACAFKFSTCEFDPVRFPRIRTTLLKQAFSEATRHGLACGVHNENQEVVKDYTSQLQDDDMSDPLIHARVRPEFGEALAMFEIYELGRVTDARAHVVHCSIGRGVEICNYYKSIGTRASVELLLPHLTLSEDDVRRLVGFGKINPPIRSAEHRENLWEHIKQGNVDIISTDHVCWSRARKDNPHILKNASGLPGVDIFVPMLLTEAEKRSVPVHLISNLITRNPAAHFGFSGRKGGIAVGGEADLIVVSPADYTYSVGKSQLSLDWSPYEGRQVNHKIAATFVRGRMVWDGSSICVEPGYGRLVRPHGSG